VSLGRYVIIPMPRSQASIDVVQVLRVSFASGQEVIVRYLRKPSSDKEIKLSQRRTIGQVEWREKRFDCEFSLLRWLGAKTSLPVPEGLDIFQIPDDFPHKLALTRRLPGIKVFNGFAKSSEAVKVTVPSIPVDAKL